MCEEIDWQNEFGQVEQFDLIISNMSLHWVNDLEGVFNQFLHTLEPDGAFISASLGGDSLQELRICMNLAEQERLGGISPATSPFLSLTQLGNLFSRCGYNLPTLDVDHVQVEFTGALALLNWLEQVGEQGALRESKPGLRTVDTLAAAAAIYETLFTKKTIGQRDADTVQSILVDTLKDAYMFDHVPDISQIKNENSYLDKKLAKVDKLTEQQEQ